MASSPGYFVAFAIVVVLCRGHFTVEADCFEVSLNKITPWQISSSLALPRLVNSIFEICLLHCRHVCDNPPRKIPYYRLNQSTLVIKQ
jgi:hypothetical protein